MSEAQQTDQPDDGARPWHGTDNPLEALYLHFTAEIAALKAKWAPEQAYKAQPPALPGVQFGKPADSDVPQTVAGTDYSAA